MRMRGDSADFLRGSDAMRPSYPNPAVSFKRNKMRRNNQARFAIKPF
jgi:hypothetical protein